MIFTSGGELTDSFSWGNVVGSGSFGGIAGFALTGTYERNYTTQVSVGAGSVSTASSYNGTTLPAATSNGTQLPNTWSSSVWSVADRPTLSPLPIPARPLYVKVGSGTSSIYGDPLGIGFTVVDDSGLAVNFGSGAYANLTGTSGSGVYTVDNRAHANSYSSVSYLFGLGLTGSDADKFILNPFSTSGSHTVTARQLTLSLSNTGVTKIYDGTPAAPSGFVPGFVVGNLAAGDTAAAISHTSALFNDADVLGANMLTVGGMSLTGITGTNSSLTTDYSLPGAPLNVAATITPMSIVISGISAQDKIYDGMTAATIDVSSITYGGIVSGDVLTVSGTTGAFSDKHVGVGKSVVLSGTTLGGADASNYTVSHQASTTADITPYQLVVGGLSANNKTYDATITATLSGTATISPLAGEDVAVDMDGSVASFSDKNVGAGKSVTVSGIAISGADTGNYLLQQPTSLTADIAPATLLVTANDDAKFVTKADVGGYAGASYEGFVGGEGVGDLSGSVSITRAGMGTDEAAGTYANALVASGHASSNYNIQYVSGNYVIVPADELIVRFGNSSNTYGDPNNYQFLSAQYMDGTNTVTTLAPPTVSGNRYTFDDGVGGSASFDLVPVGESLATSGSLQVGSYVLDAVNVLESSVNFSNSLTVVGNLSVDPTAVAVSATGVTKTYDGTTGMDGLSLGLSGVVSGDALNVTGAGAYADWNAGSGISYSVNDISLSGSDAANYYLTGGATLSGSDGAITPRNVTITAPTVSRVYNGSTAYIPSTGEVSSLSSQLGVVGDSISGLTLTFDNKNVGTGKTLSASGAVIADGNGGANYSISYSDDTNSVITRLSNVAWIGGANGNWSNPANWSDGAIPDLANVANVMIPDGVTPLFDNSVPGPVEIDSYTGGNFLMNSGVLEVSQDMSVQGFVQNSGTLTVGGDLTVDAGNTQITQGNLASASVRGTTTLASTVDITLDSPFNDLQGPVNLAGRNVTLRNGVSDLTLGDVGAFGDLSLSSDAGSILKTVDSEVVVGGDTMLIALRDVLLDDEGHIFGGIVDICAENAEIFQSVGDLVLGTVKVANDFWANTNGGAIRQTSGGSVTIGGTTTLISKNGVYLTGDNGFTGSVIVDALLFDFGDNDVQVVKRGLALTDELMESAAADPVFDTFLRPQKTASTSSDGLSSFIYDQLTNWWYRLAGTLRIGTRGNQLTIQHIEQVDSEVHIVHE